MIQIEKALENLKIPALNDMQQAATQAAREDKDLVLLAPTGSGKTLCFLLPIWEKLEPGKQGVQALVIVPSRELAIQIEQVFRQMGTGYKVNAFYGGHSVETEKNNLEEPPALMIGTPGRLADHIQRGHIDLSSIHTLVLDEFDKSLQLGFEDQMAFIMESLGNLQRRILTSATHEQSIPRFTGIHKPVILNYLGGLIPPKLSLKAVRATGSDKFQALFRLICKTGSKPVLIFCNHRDAVERIGSLLEEQGLEHGIFHGGLEQDARERALIKYRNGSHRILVTTDLASRGLDIPEVEYVMHYQLPDQENAFIHRNGRTARMHATGTAYLVMGEEDTLPSWLTEAPVWEELPEQALVPENPEWTTLYISAGKKDKINKTDIAGFLHQKGKLLREDVGKIEVLDHAAFVAVKRSKVNAVLKLSRNEKIKKQQVKIDIAR